MQRLSYPFAALVGQKTLRLALLLVAVNPRIGGVLLRGEKGTAKSTMARGLVSLLPEIAVSRGCPFSCNPQEQALCPYCSQKSQKNMQETEPVLQRASFVDLPLNATEDRLAGGIDFPASLQKGRIVFAPGLLARAHRGLLYVDEVNLLDDHLVDLILDVAAGGENRVEREGVSFIHPARFALVGSMNPEEGELRPQLLDRFGLCVDVRGEGEAEERVLLMERREAFDADPQTFVRQYQQENTVLAEQIDRGRRLVAAVQTPVALRRFICELCRENNVAGHRADLVLEQAACALAALEGRSKLRIADIERLAPLVLLHRRREVQSAPPPQEKQPPEPPQLPEMRDGEGEQKETQQQEGQNKEGAGQGENREPAGPAPEAHEGEPQGEEQEEEPPQAPEQEERQGREDQVFAVGAPFAVKTLSARKDRLLRRGSGRRSRSRIAQKKGRYVKSTRFNNDLALDATLRAAAPHQKSRRKHLQHKEGLALLIQPGDLRGKVREKRIGNLLLFVVDASGSMGARGRMAASKGAIMSLLLDAYRKRDQVAMISFRKNEAMLNLPPTTSIDLAGKLLAEMPVGGRTPLSAALAQCHQELRNYLVKNPGGQPIVILLSDGKANVALGTQKPLEESLALAAALAQHSPATFIVVDTEEPGLVSFGLARSLALAMQARYCKIDDLRAETLVNLVQEHNS